MRRKILLSWLLVLMWALAAFGDVTLYRGTGSIGTVQALEESGRMFVPVVEVGGIFGFSARRTGEELLLTRGNAQIRFMLNSGAAWQGMAIIPLYSAPFERNGRIWIDSQSAASVFQIFAGRGQSARLHFVKGTAPQPVMATAPTQQAPMPIMATAPTQQAPMPIMAASLPQPKPVRTQTQPVQVQTASLPQPQQVRTQPVQIQTASLPQPQPVRTQTQPVQVQTASLPQPQPVRTQTQPAQIQTASLPQPQPVRTQTQPAQIQAASLPQQEIPTKPQQDISAMASLIQPQTQESAPEPAPEPVMTAAKVPDTPEEIDLRLKELDDALRFDTIQQNNAPVIDLSKPTPDTAKPKISEPAVNAANTTQNIEDIDARLKQIDAENKAQSEARKAEQEKAARAPKHKPVKQQPRLQTFRPEDSSEETPEFFSGTIQVIRWTASDAGTIKIKAVVETDEGAEPQVYISDGKIHALFAGVAGNAEGLASPYENVAFAVNETPEGTELVFTPTGFTKAEKVVLNNPRRIAFDFSFPDDVEIADSQQKAATEQNTGIQTAQPAQDSSRPAPEIPTVFEPETPRRRSPAVTTPPSTITIPTSPAAAAKLRGRKTVVIDPGHGGKDPGASDNGVIEKNVNLAVGLELERVLSAKGYRVVMTRNTDVYLTLQERTDIANREEADLFVSIHVNALPSKKSLAGFEIYIMALPTDKDAMNLAKAENREYVEGKGMDVANVDRRTEMLLMILGDMQQNNKISESTDFAAALYNAGAVNGLPMRRIAQAPFFVLRGAGMPAVLLEVGFLTNSAEAQNLVNPVYQQRIAQAMAAGIVNYLK